MSFHMVIALYGNNCSHFPIKANKMSYTSQLITYIVSTSTWLY